MIITISGPPGSGKTTVGKLLAENLNYEFISTGMVFRHMAEEREISLGKLGEMALKDHEIDKELDKRIYIIVKKKKNLVLEGRLAGHMMHLKGILAFKIWVDAHMLTRVQRISGREEKTVEQVLEETNEREDCEWQRYHDIYGIDSRSLAIYDMVVQSDVSLPDEIVAEIIEKLEAKNE